MARINRINPYVYNPEAGAESRYGKMNPQHRDYYNTYLTIRGIQKYL